MTALAVLRLVEQGKLNLDADVSQYLRSWKLPTNKTTDQKAVTLRELLSHTPIYSVKTMQQRLDEAFARPSFYRTAIWSFAGFAMPLTMIGVYGLLAYGVARRTNEIGIRMTLGATPSNVGRMVLQEALLMVCIGLTVGVPLVFCTRSVAANLIGNPPTSLAEPIAIGAAAIIAAALLAAYLPALRAMRVDPMVALRHE